MRIILLLLLLFLLSRLVRQTFYRSSGETPSGNHRERNGSTTTKRKAEPTITRIKEKQKKVLDSSDAEYAEFEEIEEKAEMNEEG